MAVDPSTTALIEAAVTAAVAVADASDAGEYLTRQQAESAIATARTAIQAAIDEVRRKHPTTGYATVAALKSLATRLLDLDRALVDELEVVEVRLTAERSLLDLARERYGADGQNDLVARAEGLAALNPTLLNIGRIPAGTRVCLYVR